MSVANKIFFDQGKAKGKTTQEESKDVPQVIGISKKQFFSIIIASIITGAGMFGLGYIMATFYKRQMTITEHATPKLNEAVNMAAQVINDAIEKKNTTQEQHYISFGLQNDSGVKTITNALIQSGYTPRIKIAQQGKIIYLGPFNTKGEAETTMESIKLSANLHGAYVRAVDE
jgi:hypothetical protein